MDSLLFMSSPANASNAQFPQAATSPARIEHRALGGVHRGGGGGGRNHASSSESSEEDFSAAGRPIPNGRVGGSVVKDNLSHAPGHFHTDYEVDDLLGDNTSESGDEAGMHQTQMSEPQVRTTSRRPLDART